MKSPDFINYLHRRGTRNQCPRQLTVNRERQERSVFSWRKKQRYTCHERSFCADAARASRVLSEVLLVPGELTRRRLKHVDTGVFLTPKHLVMGKVFPEAGPLVFQRLVGAENDRFLGKRFTTKFDTSKYDSEQSQLSLRAGQHSDTRLRLRTLCDGRKEFWRKLIESAGESVIQTASHLREYVVRIGANQTNSSDH